MSDIENRLRASMRFGVLDGNAEERGILGAQIEEAIRELVRLRARAEAAERERDRLRGALETLSTAERHYRDMYQRHGGQALDTGRAWDMLRKAGVEARAALAKAEEVLG